MASSGAARTVDFVGVVVSASYRHCVSTCRRARSKTRVPLSLGVCHFDRHGTVGAKKSTSKRKSKMKAAEFQDLQIRVYGADFASCHMDH
jgi:hypothetical protein